MTTTGSELLVSRLSDRGIILPLAPGLYVQGPEMQRLGWLLTEAFRDLWRATADLFLHVPSILPVGVAMRTGYLVAFPHLAIVAKAQHGDTVSTPCYSGQNWSAQFDQPRYVLTAAACHGVYPFVPAPLSGNGFRAEAIAACSRNEQTSELGRFINFHMLEIVQVGTSEVVESFLEEIGGAAEGLLTRLGLAPQVVPASDPFFMSERMGALAEQSESRKREFVVDIVGTSQSVAIGSINNHYSHFTTAFEISIDQGLVSACIGFGLERLALALYALYGDEVDHWPKEVLDVLRMNRSRG